MMGLGERGRVVVEEGEMKHGGEKMCGHVVVSLLHPRFCYDTSKLTETAPHS